VDPVSRRDFWRLLYRLPAEGVTILVSTPYMDEAERCDRVALLDEGRVLARGTVDELKAGVRGALFNIVATPQDRARATLGATPGVQSVVLFGDRLHVAAREGTEAGALRRALEAAGVECVVVEALEPGLEDCFAAVLADRAGGASQ
jgi:ABC-2 type transport system ATP-binding protein